jgi:hypothetical protein
MEATRSSETSVSSRPTRLNIPGDGVLHSQCRENLKSYIRINVYTLNRMHAFYAFAVMMINRVVHYLQLQIYNRRDNHTIDITIYKITDFSLINTYIVNILKIVRFKTANLISKFVCFTSSCLKRR